MLARATAAFLVAATALVVSAPSQAGSSKCPTKNAVITQQQQIIYFVRGEYRGCYKKTGKVTRLITKGKDYVASGVVAHGTHATVLESVFDPLSQLETVENAVTMWNLKKGKPFRAHVLQLPPSASVGLIDDIFGDPVTAVIYEEGGKNVLDVIFDKGYERVSGTGSVKAKTVKVAKRKVSWTEGSKKRSKRF